MWIFKYTNIGPKKTKKRSIQELDGGGFLVLLSLSETGGWHTDMWLPVAAGASS